MRAMMTRDSGLLRTAAQDLQDRPGVYCIFNSESEMMYIGCSNSIKNRIYTHKRHLSSGEHVCKQMSADFVRNPDSFVFFYIEYVDYSDYGTLEFHRSVLLNRETQYMKRVPHLRLYNNNVPVSLSEKMLIGDTPKDLIKIHVSDIFRRLEMSPDSIRANGLTIQDEMTIGEAVKFVRKRTVASGRWPQEKAALAIEYLAELEAQMGSGFDSESALRASGDFDYFGEYVVKVDPSERKPQSFVMPSWRAVRRFIVDVLLFCAVVAHALLIWYDCATLWDVPGQIGGGALFLIVLAALLLASDSDLPRTSGIAMAFIFFVDLAAWKVHFEVFKTPLVDNLITGSLCAFICATSYMALYIFRDKRIS